MEAQLDHHRLSELPADDHELPGVHEAVAGDEVEEVAHRFEVGLHALGAGGVERGFGKRAP